VKLLATLTVLVANIVVCLCILLLYQLVNQEENLKYLVAVSCTLLLCLLVIITATLDNVSWWSKLFPDAFMSTESVTDLLNRLSVAEPGYKVTIQQDFFTMSGVHQVPKCRQRSIEMFKPNRWEDMTRLPTTLTPGVVVSIKVEVAPADREAREDFNKFIREMVEQNSNNGLYDKRFLTGVIIEARMPQMPLFQGNKIPKFSTANRNDKISFPLSHNFQKISGDSVRIYIYKDNIVSRSLFPILLSFKRILFIVILLLPVLGTCLSLILADKSTMIVFKKRYGRRKNLEESLREDRLLSQRLRLTRHLTQDLLRFNDGESLEADGDMLSSIAEDESCEAASSEWEEKCEEERTVSVLTPLLAGPSPDMPPSYSRLTVSPPPYQDAIKGPELDEILTTARETQLL